MGQSSGISANRKTRSVYKIVKMNMQIDKGKVVTYRARVAVSYNYLEKIKIKSKDKL